MRDEIPRLIHVTTVPMTLGFLRGQVRDMRERGFLVHVISSPGLRLDRFGEEQGVKTHAIEFPRRITPFQDIGSIRKLRETLRRINPSIVHAHTPKAGLLGMIAAGITRVPVRIYHIHGLPYMTAHGWRRLLLRSTEKVASRVATQVFCVSQSIEAVAIKDRICNPDKIRVVAGGTINGVDASGLFNPGRFSQIAREHARERLGIPLSAPVIGFVGRVVRDKGIQELADAWRQLRETFPTAHLVIAGPIEPQDPVDPETLTALVADPQVHTLGMVDDTSEIYPLFDLVVLPTYREGFPNVPLEAASMELPVVATRIPGCIDAVQDGVTGTLVPPRDAEALRAAIERYLDDPELRNKHGKAGRERVLRDFRQEVIWEATYQEYCRLLTEKGLPIPVPRELNAARAE